MSTILISGSLAYDRIMNFPGRFRDHLLPSKLHVLSVSFMLDQLREHFGGTAGNIAYSLALLKIRPVIAAAAGKDFAVYRSWLRKNRIDLRGVVVLSDLPTAVATILTDRDDNQLTGFLPGALRAKLPATAVRAAFQTKPSLVILAPGNLDATHRLALESRRRKIPYVFDPGQQLPVFSKTMFRELVGHAAVFISNDYEFAMTLKKLGWNAARFFRHVPVTVTTLGPKGSLAVSQGTRVRVRAARVANTSDPTGAGDAFRAGFAAGYVRHLPLRTALRMGNVAAAYTVERLGTQTHIFTPAHFINRYQKNYHETLTV